MFPKQYSKVVPIRLATLVSDKVRQVEDLPFDPLVGKWISGGSPEELRFISVRQWRNTECFRLFRCGNNNQGSA
jgi:hypothetical protein